MRRLLQKKETILTVLVLLALLWSAIALLQRIFFEFQGTYEPDVEIFLAVGRSILNGLKPYLDLFESKPPLIFLLSALSLTFTQGALLLKITQGIFFAILPLAITWYGFLVTRGAPRERRMLLIASTSLFGVLLTLYSAHYAGEGMPEGFGAVAGSLTVLAYAWNDRGHPSSWKTIGIAALGFFFSIGFKEPFFLSVVAGCLVLTSDLRNLKRLIAPFTLAALIGATTLAALGILGVYLRYYLPHMFFHHDDVAGQAPILMRIFFLHKIWLNLQQFSLPFAFVITLLWLRIPVSLVRQKESIVWWAMWGIASLFALVAVALGGTFYTHHFIFAVPFFAALGLTLLHANLEASEKFEKIFSSICVALLILAAVFHTSLNYTSHSKSFRDDLKKKQEIAKTIDTVMDRCTFDRYLHLIERESGIYGHTHHSPLGPIFIFYLRFLGADIRYAAGLQKAILYDAPIAIAIDEKLSPLENPSWKTFEEQFTTKPPACAGTFSVPEPFKLYFRR